MLSSSNDIPPSTTPTLTDCSGQRTTQSRTKQTRATPYKWTVRKKIDLFKEYECCNPYTAAYGKVTETWELILKKYQTLYPDAKNVSVGSLRRMCEDTLAQRKAENKWQRTLSGTNEAYEELEILLDGIIEVNDDHDAGEANKKKLASRMQALDCQIGQDIRAAALTGMKRKTPDDQVLLNEADSTTPDQSRKKGRRKSFDIHEFLEREMALEEQRRQVQADQSKLFLDNQAKMMQQVMTTMNNMMAMMVPPQLHPMAPPQLHQMVPPFQFPTVVPISPACQPNPTPVFQNGTPSEHDVNVDF